MLSEQDEQLHPPTSAAQWQESYYFNWANLDGSVFGLARIGLNRSAERGDAVVLSLRDGDLELAYAEVGVPIGSYSTSTSVAVGVSVGRLTFTMEEPFSAWRLSLGGGNSFELEWTASTPPIDFGGGFPGAVTARQEHFEQSGVVRGTTRYDGLERTITGIGQRDKSWGVRDWNGLNGWDWIAGQFGEDLAFNATQTDVDGERHSAGYIFLGGVVHGVVDVDVSYDCVRAHEPDSATITIRTDDGERHVMRATTLGRVPLIKEGLFIEETHTRFEYGIGEAARTGVGVMEHAYHVGDDLTDRQTQRLTALIESVSQEAGGSVNGAAVHSNEGAQR